jgi:Cytochrome b(C-terminal)/b6/petD
MHGHVDLTEFLQDIALVLGCYYVAVGAMNAVAAVWLWRSGKTVTYFRMGPLPVTNAWLWAGVAGLFFALALLAMTGSPSWMRLVSLPHGVKEFLDRVMNPTWYMLGIAGALIVVFAARRFFVKPSVAWTGLNLALLFLGLSLTDPNFAAIVAKPDNVPIVGMVFLLGYFTWLGAAQAVKNDERTARGEPTLEALESEKVLVWPDLVYIELICMVLLTALLIVWAIGLKAPLEAPANAVKTPNPSKAPWYFLGLQEMLVYYDAWMAGVVLPLLIIFGLMAIPYLDRNPQGNGYYSIRQRKFAYLTFQFGFLVLWVTLITMGTFFRGPNWNFFGLYETWDTRQVVKALNVDLSQLFWVKLWGVARPAAPEEAGGGTRLLYILWRESPGLLLLAAYFIAIPAAVVKTSRWVRELVRKMGLLRFLVMSNLLLMMALLPVKMLARWTLDLKYFVAIPEYFLNF